MEGIKKLCLIAEEEFQKIADKERFEVIQGIYDTTFPSILEKCIQFDIIFIDGNHKKEPTLNYFNSLKPKLKLKKKATIVFDDINWTKEMEEAWEIIKKVPLVSYSVDLFKLGVVIIENDDENRNISSKLFLGL